MSLRLAIINPLDIPDWDARVLAFEQATVFHCAAWARVLIESYGFQPRYCAGYDGDDLAAVIALMEVRDILGKRKGISLPFSDFAPPLFRDATAFDEVFAFAKETGRSSRWHSLTIRGDAPFADDVVPSTSYYRHVLQLTPGESGLRKGLRGAAKRNIDKAAREKVTVSFESAPQAIEEFYRLNCRTRKRHGLPPQPMYFLRALHRIVISRGQGEIAIARLDNAAISASVFMNFGTTTFYKYGASDERFGGTCANYAVIWEAIRRACTAGRETFCFGRTERHHEGLLQFKNGWGARQLTVNNYRYDLRKGAFVGSPLMTSGLHNAVFARTPMPLLKLIGSLVYKYAA